MRRKTGAGGLVLVALVAASLVAAWSGERTERAASPEIVAAAEAFLASVDGPRRERAARPFEDEERFDWHFVPRVRTGLPLADMTLAQREAALELLRSATSSQGYLKATGVMRLEEILRFLENRPDFRDPEAYFFWVFGTPSRTEPWGWRFEGHHISLNFTSAAGLTVSTPSFMGANPARVPAGPHAGWRLLGNEEDLARRLLLSLDSDQCQRAVISEVAPPDIITGNDRRARLERLEGLPAGEMTDEQRALLLRIVAEYVGNAEPEIARARMARIEEAGIERLHFAWAGEAEPGRPHYYRVHGPTLLIEYDNTQNDANHVHSVWRDLESDFGEDLLRLHYERVGASHGHDHRPAHVRAGRGRVEEFPLSDYPVPQ